MRVHWSEIMALGSLKFVALVVGLGMAVAGHAQPVSVGQITVCDGPVEVVRGRVRFEAREGILLYAQDIVHTSPNARVARLEMPQGTAIDLGPSTQLLLHPPVTPWPGDQSALGYLALGWAKLSVNPPSPAAPQRVGLATASVHAAPELSGVVLLHAQDSDSTTSSVFVFAESGSARLSEYAATAPKTRAMSAKVMAVVLTEGQAYRRTSAQIAGNTPGDVLARASATMLSQVPPQLRVTLPMRAGQALPPTAPMRSAQPLDVADMVVWSRVADPLRAHVMQRLTWPASAQSSLNAPRISVTNTAPRPTAARTAMARPRSAPQSLKPMQIVAAANRSTATASGGVAMMLERDAKRPASIDAVIPGEAVARSALPVTNTRMPESTWALAPSPVLPDLNYPPPAAPPTAAATSSTTAARGRTAASNR
jgi:hypothetical protein